SAPPERFSSYSVGVARPSGQARMPAPQTGYLAAMSTDATTFSHARVSVPFLPSFESSVILYVSTKAGGFDIFMDVRPTSLLLSSVVLPSLLMPHWPVCLLTISFQALGSSC